MKLYLSKITQLVGGALQLDFGNIIQCSIINAKGKTRKIERGEYQLQFFDCAWRFMKNEKILFGCFDYEENDYLSIDGIQYHNVELLSLISVNLLDQRIILSDNISIDIFPASKSVYKPIHYFTDRNNNEVDIMEILEKSS